MVAIRSDSGRGTGPGDLLAKIQAILDVAHRAGQDADEQAALDEIARLLPRRRSGEIYQKPLG